MPKLRAFMRELGRSRATGRVDLVGGATAVLEGWRSSTIAIDCMLEPESDELFLAIVELKNWLSINVELANPTQFVPELPGWRDRSPFIGREGSLDFHHFDFYSQALAKLARDHERDRVDVEAMVTRGLVDPSRLRELFERVEASLIRYPALDAAALRKRVEELADGPGG